MPALKYSRQREAILQNLRQRTDHPTAEAIYSDIRNDYPNLSLGTVYRNLSLLSGLGEIRRLPSAEGADRFDARMDEHAHFTCRRCGAIMDLPAVDCSPLIGKIQKSFGGIIDECNVCFRGVCSSCRNI